MVLAYDIRETEKTRKREKILRIKKKKRTMEKREQVDHGPALD